MENIWQTAKRLLLVEEAKKRSDTAHAYSLEIGKQRNKPPPAELQQYLIPPYKLYRAYKLLRQRKTGIYFLSDTAVQTSPCLQTIMAEGDRPLFNHRWERNVNTLDRVWFEPCRS